MLTQDYIRPEHLDIVQVYNVQEIVSNAENLGIQESRDLDCMGPDESFIHITHVEWEVLKDFVEKKIRETLEPGPVIPGGLPSI